MRNFDASMRRSFALVTALASAATLLGACGTYGDPCLRTTDCGSGFVCVEGRCQVDLGDNPGDAAVGDAPVGPSDGPSSGDAASSDASRDVSTDASGQEGSAPPPDSAGSDGARDGDGSGALDGDAAETSSIDARFDASGGVSDVGTSSDALDARAATDAGGANAEAASPDARTDADSGAVTDVTLDAFDAAG